MEITLRNGEKINLDISPIIFEYLEEYDGGLQQLLEDSKGTEHRFLAFNFIVYCFVISSIDEDLNYRQVLRLVNINDYYDIANFVIKSINEINFKDENNKPKIKENGRNITRHRK